jgi:hypothetical protein
MHKYYTLIPSGQSNAFASAGYTLSAQKMPCSQQVSRSADEAVSYLSMHKFLKKQKMVVF